MRAKDAAAIVRKRLDYNPDTGLLTWRDGRCRGKIAGCLYPSGYRYVYVLGKLHLAHRVIWLHVHGEWPPDQIDHKNGVAEGDKLENLRPSSQSQNKANAKVRSDSASGLKGVLFDKERRRWRAYAGPRGKARWLGTFKTKEEAHAAYVKESQKLYANFARA